MAIPVNVKLPLLNKFADHFRDPEFKYVCGTNDYKRLMERLHHVRAAFFQLQKPYDCLSPLCSFLLPWSLSPAQELLPAPRAVRLPRP